MTKKMTSHDHLGKYKIFERMKVEWRININSGQEFEM